MKFARIFPLVLIWSSCVLGAVPSSQETISSSANHEIFLNLSLGAGYNYRVSPRWQIGFLPSISVGYGSGTVGVTYEAAAYIGPTFNFSEDISRSFFLRATIGLNYESLPSRNYSRITPGVQGFIGKRFVLSETFLYSPSLAVTKRLDDFYPTQVILNAIAFSAVF